MGCAAGRRQQAIAEAFQVHGISGLRTPRAYEIPTPSFK
jgi:hypothetical protein